MKRTVCILSFVTGILAVQLALAAAPFEILPIVQMEKGKYGYRGSMGDFIQMKDGTLWFAYNPSGGGIHVTKSTDLGKTWSPPECIVPNPAEPDTGYYVLPGFVRCPNGHILMSYIYGTHPATPYYGHNYYRRSTDEGKTWSEQFCMTPYPGYILMHNDRMSVTKSGRILAPVEYKKYHPSSADHNGYVGAMFYSDNNGVSWQMSTDMVDLIPEGVEVQEADAIELKDGRILMFGRTYSGHPVESYSSDGGVTWSKAEFIEEIETPSAGLPTVRRIPKTGDLVFLFQSGKTMPEGGGTWRRTPFTACISKDEGKTFEHFKNIAEDPEDDYGYQCIEFVGDDLALIGFHRRDGLHVARVGVDWFYE